MFAVHVCETFGWTYEEYLAQPLFFLETIREKMKIDAQRVQNAAKNINT